MLRDAVSDVYACCPERHWCDGWYGRYVGMQYATIQRREMRDEMGSARRAATTMSEDMYA